MCKTKHYVCICMCVYTYMLCLVVNRSLMIQTLLTAHRLLIDPQLMILRIASNWTRV